MPRLMPSRRACWARPRLNGKGAGGGCGSPGVGGGGRAATGTRRFSGLWDGPCPAFGGRLSPSRAESPHLPVSLCQRHASSATPDDTGCPSVICMAVQVLPACFWVPLPQSPRSRPSVPDKDPETLTPLRAMWTDLSRRSTTFVEAGELGESLPVVCAPYTSAKFERAHCLMSWCARRAWVKARDAGGRSLS